MALIFGAPSPQEKSAPWFGAGLLFDIGQIDGISLHQEPNCHADDQEGRHINRENLECSHGRFPAIENQDISRFNLGHSGAKCGRARFEVLAEKGHHSCKSKPATAQKAKARHEAGRSPEAALPHDPQQTGTGHGGDGDGYHQR